MKTERVVTIEDIEKKYVTNSRTTWSAFPNKKHNIIFLIIFFPIIGILCLEYIFKNNLSGLIALGVLLFFLFLIINSYAKKCLKKKGIQPEEGLLTHWMGANYKKFKISSFYSELIDIRVFDNSSDDINKADHIIVLIKEALKEHNRQITLPAAIGLSFFFPIWNNLCNNLFAWIYKYISSVELALKFFLTFTFLIICAWYVSFMCGTMFSNIFNIKVVRYREMLKLLENIKLSMFLNIKDE